MAFYNRPVDPRPVGVFDSGVGGLTVLHECLVTMPHEDFVYLGDHARLPYGPRPLEEIRGFAREIAGYLAAQDVKLVLVACNAATSAALPQLQEELDVPVALRRDNATLDVDQGARHRPGARVYPGHHSKRRAEALVLGQRERDPGRPGLDYLERSTRGGEIGAELDVGREGHLDRVRADREAPAHGKGDLADIVGDAGQLAAAWSRRRRR